MECTSYQSPFDCFEKSCVPLSSFSLASLMQCRSSHVSPKGQMSYQVWLLADQISCSLCKRKHYYFSMRVDLSQKTFNCFFILTESTKRNELIQLLFFCGQNHVDASSMCSGRNEIVTVVGLLGKKG